MEEGEARERRGGEERTERERERVEQRQNRQKTEMEKLKGVKVCGGGGGKATYGREREGYRAGE